MTTIDKKSLLYRGIGLMAGFIIVLVLIFSPIFKGHNGLEALDNLYNSISKGSAYYIPKLKDEVQKFGSHPITIDLKFKNEAEAKESALLFAKSGATVEAAGSDLKITGDLQKILESCLEDSDFMYNNQGQNIKTKYGYDEQKVLYNWWTSAKLMDKNLTKQKLFKEAKIINTVKSKAVETAYNYYKIAPQKISERYGIVIFSLVLYVIYTLWYGFAIMYIFEGVGMKLSH